MYINIEEFTLFFCYKIKNYTILSFLVLFSVFLVNTQDSKNIFLFP